MGGYIPDSLGLRADLEVLFAVDCGAGDGTDSHQLERKVTDVCVANGGQSLGVGFGMGGTRLLSCRFVDRVELQGLSMATGPYEKRDDEIGG